MGERYKCSHEAKIATGEFHIRYGDDPDMTMMFAFGNSYDKSMRFRCGIGAHVFANGASIISGDYLAWARKHTGTADEEVGETIEEQLEKAEEYFKELISNKEMMKQIHLNKRQFSHLLGVLYLELGILTGEQMNIIKKEYKKPSYKYTTGENSLWTLYNHILIALSKSHPRTWMEQQKVVHYHLMSEYYVGMFDDELSVDHPDPVDPNQISLIDQMLEVEAAGVENIVHLPTPVEVVTSLAGQQKPEEKVQEIAKEIMTNQVEELLNEGIAEAFNEVDGPPEKDVLEKFAETMVEPLKTDKPLPLSNLPEIPEEMKTEPTPIEWNDEGAPLVSAHMEVIDMAKDEQDTVKISQADVFDMYADVEIGIVIDVNGYSMKISDVDGDDFVLTPVVDEEDDVSSTTTEEDVTNTNVMEALGVPESVPMEEKAVLPEIEPMAVVKEVTVEEVVEKHGDNLTADQHQKLEEMQQTLDEEEDEDWAMLEKAGVIKEIQPEPQVEEEEEEEVVPVNEDDAVRDIIAQELYDLYGSPQEFNYVLKEDQYNVTLTTGEVVVLLQEEIDSRKTTA